MNKYIILIICVLTSIVIALVILSRYCLLDTDYLFGWSRFRPLPAEIRAKYASTLEKVDALIKKDNIDNITSHSEKFNLELYTKLIVVGVIPELKKNDPANPLEHDIQLLVEDIVKHMNKDKCRIL